MGWGYPLFDARVVSKYESPPELIGATAPKSVRRSYRNQSRKQNPRGVIIPFPGPIINRYKVVNSVEHEGVASEEQTLLDARMVLDSLVNKQHE